MKAGDSVLILDAEPIGFAVAFRAKRMGARKIAVPNVAPFQQARALKI